MQKAYSKIIFGHNYITSEPIFNIFAALFRTVGLQKHDIVIFILVAFHETEILKNAVSERWCSDSKLHSMFHVEL